MAKLGKKMSISSRSLRPQLIIAFCLMSVIPILALLNFIFPSLFPRGPLPAIIITVIAMSFLGFTLIKRIIDLIIEISSEARIIANGELSRTINIARDDEIGELSTALNQLTQHIKGNMDELRIYGERTKEINLQINKQVIALSGLLQISNLITQNAELKDVFEITISKLAQVASSSLAFVLLKKDDNFETVTHYGLKADILAAMKLPANVYLFNNLLTDKPYFKTDANAQAGGAIELLKTLNARNLLIYPILVQGKVGGFVGMGNQLNNFKYSDEDIELLSIFAKQLSIALENDFLSRKVKDLEIKDALTGLYNRRYIVARLDEEILRAISRQRPCAFITLKVKNLKDVQLRSGNLAAEDTLIKTASVLKSCAGEIDRVGRIAGDEFGMVLPEKNKRAAQNLALQINEKVLLAFREQEPDRQAIVQLSVVENPIDGADAPSLMQKAEEAIQKGVEIL